MELQKEISRKSKSGAHPMIKSVLHNSSTSRVASLREKFVNHSERLSKQGTCKEFQNKMHVPCLNNLSE